MTTRRTALITGVFGQDGSLLAERLLSYDYRVVGVVRPGSKPPDAERRALASRCELVAVDLAVPPTTSWANDLIAEVQPDEVYHLAACHHSSEGDAREDPARMIDVNFTAALALAHGVLARGRGRIVLAGSSQMFTPAHPPPRIDEQTAHAPATFYGVTKSCALAALRWLREHRGLHGSCAILFNHESPRRSLRFASRKITHAAARIAAGLDQQLELADTSSRIDFSAAADVVAGMHAMASADAPAERVIASGELHSLAEVCQIAFAAVGLDWREHVRSAKPPGDRPGLVGDPSSMERELGWSRTYTFAAWVEEMVRADQRNIAELEQ